MFWPRIKRSSQATAVQPVSVQLTHHSLNTDSHVQQGLAAPMILWNAENPALDSLTLEQGETKGTVVPARR